jgi:L-cystine uptake protein TcyP (sodium:dicarboxylate symporter family)
MKAKKIISICIFMLLLISCKNAPHNDAENIEIGKKFIDAFYSFSKDSLEAILSSAKKSQPEILYYQK